jgi:hypothetical protein
MRKCWLVNKAEKLGGNLKKNLAPELAPAW